MVEEVDNVKYFSVFDTDMGEWTITSVEEIEEGGGGGTPAEVLNSLPEAEEVEF